MLNFADVRDNAIINMTEQVLTTRSPESHGLDRECEGMVTGKVSTQTGRLSSDGAET